MLSNHPSDFQLLDDLSLSKKPFFFFIDFLMESLEVFSPQELIEHGIKVDFPNFKNDVSKVEIHKKLSFNPKIESLASYKKGFDWVQKHLRYGNSYLANYTRKTPIDTNYSLADFYHAAHAKYKVLYPGKMVFFSPETFIEIKGNKIMTHPMKGTIDANVEHAAEKLKNDTKEKAEHYTVVDLLRNDLSRVADEVKVDEFQRIDFLKTAQKDLYAMSSEISGVIKPEYQQRIGSMLKELLPAGSILGAPKKKTLEIILEAEGYSRGYYTGVCGWFDGQSLDSCVMIRFIEQENGNFFFKSGGGITHLSKLVDEYEEVKNKIYVPIHRKH
ncbi:MAG: aminodeoxychorismate synthase component I [Bacteroidetes bacterium]|nr:aminodeoxychorismate synthase component I [Bacteroidota bacterium]